ncbi:glycosyl hydrolase family 76-domain-containing protein [Aspergillus karnatakaensis]|uniref:putative glycosyl hydrolase n=1 Tax=Aspergillus karnatakaensis TaxID=1810916 RepID=UPI003CCE2524
MAPLLRALWSLLLLRCLTESHARILSQGELPQAQIHDDKLQSPLTPSQYKDTLRDLIHAIDVMQDEWFVLWEGTWPTGNDWTRAVHGTHVSATLAALSATADDEQLESLFSDDDDDGEKENRATQNSLALENLVSHFFAQVTTFYFGENAFALRNQAFDDMLWVVLGWMENIKFQWLHSDLHYQDARSTGGRPWHGRQFQIPAAHRVRIFYELASEGWDTTLCGGGMIWNPYLGPYKNAITNELFISASIGMYLYFPGDRINDPFINSGEESADGLTHDPVYLRTAEEAYRWLRHSNMTGIFDLYADGYHVRGYRNPKEPGTRKCDVLNTMVYTYNQGVILSGLRGLWLATGSDEYLTDGHELVQNVQRATGWPNIYDQHWKGLGRAGIIEDTCDSKGDCSQDGQTFKGIFWHHFAEFCRPLRPQEERFLKSQSWAQDKGFERAFGVHQALCSTYRPWIEHNAHAALITRNEDGKFGTWWGRRYREFDDNSAASHDSPLPHGATDYRNHPDSVPPFWSMNATALASEKAEPQDKQPEYNDRGRGRTVETQSGGVAVLRALLQWKSAPSLQGDFVDI